MYIYMSRDILLRNLFGWKFKNNTDQKTEEILKMKKGTTDLNPIAWVEGTGPISYSGWRWRCSSYVRNRRILVFWPVVFDM